MRSYGELPPHLMLSVRAAVAYSAPVFLREVSRDQLDFLVESNGTETQILGRGTAGDVYGATLDGSIDVAVKMFADKEAFEAEVEAASRMIGLPSVVKVIGVADRSSGSPLLVMERAPHGTLDGAFARSLPMSTRLGLVADVCEGVAGIHSRRLVSAFKQRLLACPNHRLQAHGDVKPGNALVVELPSGELHAVIGDLSNVRSIGPIAQPPIDPTVWNRSGDPSISLTGAFAVHSPVCSS